MTSEEKLFPFRRILVGLTATPADEDVLGYARMLGRIAGNLPMRFLFVHVSGAGEETDRPPVSMAAVYDRLAAAVRDRFGEASRAEVSCHVLQGPRIDALLDFAVREESDLILVGHRPGRSGRRSMARRLAMNAPASLWLVPSGAPAVVSRVLSAVDFSPPSAHAASAAARISAAAGLDTCWALNVYFNDVAIGGETLSRIQQAELDRFLQPLDSRGVRIVPQVEESYGVAEAILSAAKRGGADLVVMGTRGRSPATAVLLGSESEQVIRETGVPVLIVKPAGEREGVLQALLLAGRRPAPAVVG